MVVLPSDGRAHGARRRAACCSTKGANPNLQLKRRPPYRNVPQDRGGDAILVAGRDAAAARRARRRRAVRASCCCEHGALVDLPSKEGVTPLMAAAGVEFGLRVTRGRNRTDEGVLATMQLLLDAGRRRQRADADGAEGRRGRASARDRAAARRLQLRLPRPASAEPARDAAPHGAARRRDEGLQPDRGVPRRERRRPLRARTRTAARRSISRAATTTRRSCGRRAEPHAETVALLEKLMAEKPQTKPQTLSSNVAAAGHGGSK